MISIAAAALAPAHLGRTATIETAGTPATGTLVGLDVAEDGVTVTLETSAGGRAVIDVRPDCPVLLSPAVDRPARVFASELAGHHLGRAVDFGGLSRSYSGILTGLQAQDRDSVTIILDQGRWAEVDLDCVVEFL